MALCGEILESVSSVFVMSLVVCGGVAFVRRTQRVGVLLAKG